MLINNAAYDNFLKVLLTVRWDREIFFSFFGPLESLLFNSNSHIVFTFFILIHFSNRSIHTPQYTLTRFIYFFLVCTNLFVCLLGISVWLIQPTLWFFGPNQLTLELDWGSPRFFCLIDKLCVIIFFHGLSLIFVGAQVRTNQHWIERNEKKIKAAATRYRRVFSTGDQLTQCGARRLWRRSEAIVENVKSSLSWAQSSLSSFAQTSPSSLFDQFHALTLLSARLAEKQHKNC